jgi:hypothetical protein
VKQPKKRPDSTAPDEAGQVPLPNPGEYPADGAELGVRRNTLGTFPARGHRAGGGATVGPAERVAIMRNLEFSAGGRSALVATGPVSANQANVSERTGQVQIHGTHDTSSTAGNVQNDQPAHPPPASHDSAIDPLDRVSADGDTGPDRRRDTKGL